MSGPLSGFRVIEMAGIGPGPYACMLLSDLGADVIRVERPADTNPTSAPGDVLGRGRRSLAVNLKTDEGVEAVLKLVETADVLVEGFRPGVMEKLGLGPDVCADRNSGLVYGRVTGWGQEGPLSQAAGHDINYIALTGALASMGRRQSGPIPPLNLVGDFGGGSLFLVMGILSALLERSRSGKGQVVDAAITDGAISLMACIQGMKNLGVWDSSGLEQNVLDGGAPYYDVYRCADDKYVAIGAIEPQFYALLADKLELDLGAGDFASQFDKSRWPALKAKIADRIAEKTRDQWCDLMEGSDVCFAPVLTMDEAPDHPHNRARQSFVEIDGVVQAAPAPRFGRSRPEVRNAGVSAGADSHHILADLGYDRNSIGRLEEAGVVSQTKPGAQQ